MSNIRRHRSVSPESYRYDKRQKVSRDKYQVRDDNDSQKETSCRSSHIKKEQSSKNSKTYRSAMKTRLSGEKLRRSSKFDAEGKNQKSEDIDKKRVEEELRIINSLTESHELKALRRMERRKKWKKVAEKKQTTENCDVKLSSSKADGVQECSGVPKAVGRKEPVPDTATVSTTGNGADIVSRDSDAHVLQDSKKQESPPTSGTTGSRGITDAKPSAALDMFADHDDDEHDLIEELSVTDAKLRHSHVRHVADTETDAEGYFRPQLGEMLNNRYRVLGYHGKGVFGSVLRVEDVVEHAPVAIKLLRRNEYMKETGKGEAKFLRQLTESDPESKFNIIRLLDEFEVHDHLCLVFESMEMNLRELIKKYGKDVGLSILAVRSMGMMLLKALLHMKRNNIIHADLKPDNILVSKDKKTIKVADLGSALVSSEPNVETPLLVSRYYRAPEIVLGLKYAHPLDMFSFGCCLFEFATGKPLFNHSKNGNEHLKMIMDINGMIPKKMLIKGLFAADHFDDDLYFLEQNRDVVTGKTIVSRIQISSPKRDIVKEIRASYSDLSGSAEKEQLADLTDLVMKSVATNPSKRLTPEEALVHPFISGRK